MRGSFSSESLDRAHFAGYSDPMIRPNQPAPQRQKLLTFVTPKVADILFYEVIDVQRIGTAIPDYGTAHPDTSKWPNHKLVYVSQDGEDSQFYRYYYAADRSAQADYNYEMQEGKEVVRTYVLPRADYPTELPVPAGGTADAVFTDYGFTSDSIISLDEPLNGIYIAVQRKYGLITTVGRPYDPNLERNITITRTIKPSGFLLTDPAPDLVSGAGVIYEVEHGNDYHDVLVKTDSGLDFTSVDSYLLTEIHGSIQNYPIPPKLTAFTIYALWAEATQIAPPDYAFAQDFMAVPTLVRPARGPYKTKIVRHVTDAPGPVIDTILGASTKLPNTKEEIAAVLFARVYSTDSDSGVYAQAFAREFQVPESYHYLVTPTVSDGKYTNDYNNLTNTPGFYGTLSGNFLIDIDVKPTTADLYEVSATYLSLASDVYS